MFIFTLLASALCAVVSVYVCACAAATTSSVLVSFERVRFGSHYDGERERERETLGFSLCACVFLSRETTRRLFVRFSALLRVYFLLLSRVACVVIRVLPMKIGI